MTPPPDRPAATPSRERVSALLGEYKIAILRTEWRPESQSRIDAEIAARAALDAALASLADDAAEMRRATAVALYRVREWAPQHVTDAAWGLGPLNTDAGEALNALRAAAGILVTMDDEGNPVFRAARSPIGETPEDPT